MVPFYISGALSTLSYEVPEGDFSFLVARSQKLQSPSFLLCHFIDSESEALLCKITRCTNPATLGMSVHVCDQRLVRILGHGLLNTVFPDLIGADWSPRDLMDFVRSDRGFLPVPEDQIELVKNALLKANPAVLDGSYFHIEGKADNPELQVQLQDSWQTGFRIFGFNPKNVPTLRENQIIDFDTETAFPNDMLKGRRLGDPMYVHNGKRLWIHKAHLTKLEECLGVDLIYNFLDEQRLVLIQYKCQGLADKKYYHKGDKNHASELQRMLDIPGVGSCPNRNATAFDHLRLCGCPTFIKLCKREIPIDHFIPDGVYFSICVWEQLTKKQTGVRISDDPHFSNASFTGLAKNGLIGSRPEQTQAIVDQLESLIGPQQLLIVFSEQKTSE